MRKAVIDFSAVQRGELNVGELATRVTLPELIAATNEQIDAFVALVHDLSDREVTFIAKDSTAQDPTGAAAEGWNVAHVIAHFTATSEENAAISSILARGIPYPFEPRLRSEVEWTRLTTATGCLQRLEESRRIQLSYLNAWPDMPNVDTERTLPEAFAARVGKINAVGAVLLGLLHGDGHRAHIQEITAQAVGVLETL